MNRTEPIPSGIRLQRLTQNCHAEILGREKNNDKFIHLYSIGTYWVAFERSACWLNSIFLQCEISLFMIPDRLDYVVMASVSSDEFTACFHKYKISQEGFNYKVLEVKPLGTEYYQKWHMGAVRSVIC